MSNRMVEISCLLNEHVSMIAIKLRKREWSSAHRWTTYTEKACPDLAEYEDWRWVEVRTATRNWGIYIKEGKGTARGDQSDQAAEYVLRNLTTWHEAIQKKGLAVVEDCNNE